MLIIFFFSFVPNLSLPITQRALTPDECIEQTSSPWSCWCPHSPGTPGALLSCRKRRESQTFKCAGQRVCTFPGGQEVLERTDNWSFCLLPLIQMFNLNKRVTIRHLMRLRKCTLEPFRILHCNTLIETGVGRVNDKPKQKEAKDWEKGSQRPVDAFPMKQQLSRVKCRPKPAHFWQHCPQSRKLVFTDNSSRYYTTFCN